jgi:hypothetical protein
MRTHTALIAALALTTLSLVAGCGGSDNKTSTGAGLPAPAKRAAASAATVGDLRALKSSTGHDIFWAGHKRGYTYELTNTTEGNIYIRYLPPGVPVGAAGGDFLSIGTYPQTDAFATVKAARKQDGEVVTEIPGGGFAVANPNRPQSVYFAFPGSKLLVEVYDPDPARAKRLIVRGQVVPLR